VNENKESGCPESGLRLHWVPLQNARDIKLVDDAAAVPRG